MTGMRISSLRRIFVLRPTFHGPPDWWFLKHVRFSVFDRRREDPLCRVVITFFAKQVIHERDGPKLPDLAVVFRQSAKHRSAGMPSCRKAVWTLTRVEDRSPFSVVFVESIRRKRARTAGNKSPIELQPPRRTGCCHAYAAISTSRRRVLPGSCETAVSRSARTRSTGV